MKRLKLKPAVHDDVDINANPFVTTRHMAQELASAMDIPVVEAYDLIKMFGSIMADHLLAGRTVPIPSVGRIRVKETLARDVYSPATGKRVFAPSRWKVSFKVSTNLKMGVRNAGQRYFENVGDNH